MDHVAILKTSWNLIPKILTKEKTIESRWYKARIAPWNRIKTHDIIYFKDAGKEISLKAEVEKVLQFENYTDKELKELIKMYGGKGNIFLQTKEEKFYKWAKTKKYAILL